MTDGRTDGHVDAYRMNSCLSKWVERKKFLREEKSWDEKSMYSIELFVQYLKDRPNQEFIPSLRDF